MAVTGDGRSLNGWFTRLRATRRYSKANILVKQNGCCISHTLFQDWVQLGAAGATTGTFATTLEGAIQVEFIGQIKGFGDLASTLEGGTLAVAGQIGGTGTFSVTLDAAVLEATGQIGGTGDLASTLEDVTVSFTGQVGGTGSLSTTLEDVVTAFTGQISGTGAFSTDLEGCVLAAVGAVTYAVNGIFATTLSGAYCYWFVGDRPYLLTMHVKESPRAMSVGIDHEPMRVAASNRIMEVAA